MVHRRDLRTPTQYFGPFLQPLSFFHVKSTGNEQVAARGQARVSLPLRRQERDASRIIFEAASRLSGDQNVMAGQGTPAWTLVAPQIPGLVGREIKGVSPLLKVTPSAANCSGNCLIHKKVAILYHPRPIKMAVRSLGRLSTRIGIDF